MAQAAWRQKNVRFWSSSDTNLAQQIVMTDKCFEVSHFLYLLPQNILRDQKELIEYEAMSMKYCKCASLVSLQLTRMQSTCFLRSIILPRVTCLVLPYFFTLSHKRHDFQKKKFLRIKCSFICSTTFVWNISNSKKSPSWYYHECI